MIFYMFYTINALLYWLCLGFSTASSRGSCKESYLSFLNSCKSPVQGLAMLKSRHIPASEIIRFGQKVLPTETSTDRADARDRSWATGAYWGEARTLAKSLTQSVTQIVIHPLICYRKCRNQSCRLPFYVSDTAANSQDGSSLECIEAAAARKCKIQNARGGGLWPLIARGSCYAKMWNIHTLLN